MFRRWFLFLVCFGGRVPFFKKHAGDQFFGLVLHALISPLRNAIESIHRFSNYNHLQNVSEKCVSIAPIRRISTPRPRKQSPGFLLLNPQLTTDKEGQSLQGFNNNNAHAQNDGVMRVVEDGKIGAAATDFIAFVPFLSECELVSAAPVSGTSLST